jgi:hypothetical protein
MFMELKMKIIEKIYDVETNEEISFERDATPDELLEAQRLESENAERAAKELKAQSIKAALLQKLGITEEEAKLLLS